MMNDLYLELRLGVFAVFGAKAIPQSRDFTVQGLP